MIGQRPSTLKTQSFFPKDFHLFNFPQIVYVFFPNTIGNLGYYNFFSDLLNFYYNNAKSSHI
jgi:hypothetical protein